MDARPKVTYSSAILSRCVLGDHLNRWVLYNWSLFIGEEDSSGTPRPKTWPAHIITHHRFGGISRSAAATDRQLFSQRSRYNSIFLLLLIYWWASQQPSSSRSSTPSPRWPQEEEHWFQSVNRSMTNKLNWTLHGDTNLLGELYPCWTMMTPTDSPRATG